MKSRNQARKRKQLRIRNKISGTASVPRLNVFKSLKNFEAQLIDDVAGTTLASASSADAKGTKTEQAAATGKLIAATAKKAGVEAVVFDRGGFLYHGRVKALADSAREAGLKF